MVVADPGIHSNAAFVTFRIIACVLQRRLRQFEKHALLRIHHFGLKRMNAEKCRVEKIRPLDQASRADVVRIMSQVFFNARPQFFGRKK